MIKILDRGQHGRTLCLSLGKPTIAPRLYVELDLDSFIKVVDMGVTFVLALVEPHSYIPKLSYD